MDKSEKVKEATLSTAEIYKILAFENENKEILQTTLLKFTIRMNRLLIWRTILRMYAK